MQLEGLVGNNESEVVGCPHTHITYLPWYRVVIKSPTEVNPYKEIILF